jgi:hypothetical protein
VEARERKHLGRGARRSASKQFGLPANSDDSGDALPPGYWLHFRATMNTGSPFDASIYCIMWRVTNTDEHAAGENALRGNFVKPESDNSRWELLKFRGVHIVEAFVLRKRDDRIVGKSPAYHVMIE